MVIMKSICGDELKLSSSFLTWTTIQWWVLKLEKLDKVAQGVSFMKSFCTCPGVFPWTDWTNKWWRHLLGKQWTLVSWIWEISGGGGTGSDAVNYRPSLYIYISEFDFQDTHFICVLNFDPLIILYHSTKPNFLQQWKFKENDSLRQINRLCFC